MTAASSAAVSGFQQGETKKYVQASIAGQLFGIDVTNIEDVLLPQPYTKIPQSSPEIRGMINLRGRIVTIISIRRALGLEDASEGTPTRNIVLNNDGNLYSLEVDNVAEILDVSDADIRRTPDNINERWKDLSLGVYSLEGALMVMLDLDKLFRMLSASE